MDHDLTLEITGRSAADIAASVRALIERGGLQPGDPLPPVRNLAESLGVNRNTAVAAYRQLTSAGMVVTRGRGGTHVADRSAVAQHTVGGEALLRDGGAVGDVRAAAAAGDDHSG